MLTLLKHPDDVKHVFVAIGPRTGKYAVFLATDRQLITIPVIVGQINPFSLFYRPQEFDYLDHYVHESGLVAVFPDVLTAYVPIKDLPGWPFPRSLPADFETAIIDFGQTVEFSGIGLTDIVILLWRPAQPGEISQRDINFVNRAYGVRQRDSQDHDPHDQAEPPGQELGRHSRLPAPTKPRPKTASAELQLSLHRIPAHALAWPISLGLPFGACVLYLITRRFPARRGQRTDRLYSDAGAKQLLGYMILFLPILKKNVPGQWKRLPGKLKLTLSNVEYWHVRLRDIGLVVPIGTAKPGVRTARRVVSRTEKERRQNLLLARRVRQHPWQPHKALIP